MNGKTFSKKTRKEILSMKIKRFQFDDNKRNWHLDETTFESLNLFVGISAVGKTRILKSLSLVQNVAIKDDYSLDGIEWVISFAHNGIDYIWMLKSSLVENESTRNTFENLKTSREARIIYEKLINSKENIVIFEREKDKLQWYNDKNTPKIKQNESVITVFSEEEAIRPVREAFNCLILLEKNGYSSIGFSEGIDIDNIKMKDNNNKPLNLNQFKEISTKLPMPLKAFFLQKFYQKEFKNIKEEFIEVFPFVKELKINHIIKAGEYRIFLAIKEKDSIDWIPQSQISSGMFNIFLHLIEIHLAPDGAVILIDEFENSLGTNCMPVAADLINEYSNKLQFIITSHHPYIINEISWKNWKIVKRKGGKVTVVNSTDIPELETTSTLEKYVRLINLPIYEEGIA